MADEKTFIMIKPEGVRRGLIAPITKRFERRGYKLIAAKLMIPSRTLAEQHYAEHKGKPFCDKIVTNLSSGPVFCMAWEGKDAIKQGRAILGQTNPLNSAPGTVRGDFCIDTGRNVAHGSDGLESSGREIALWFTPAELCSWTRCDETCVYE